uniref:Ribulose-phosphate 3-epimerase n=1 Tax=Dermatophagoides pteronyssinus TaxID=6956 RepID=A0A6P6YMG7_DERPT|nr:uncharacterized protein LOC113799891 [Dermatophagoides pteronyssinus]
MPILAPSILAADFSNLEREIIEVCGDAVNVLHVDIMDGHFVPNITFGPDVVKALKKKFFCKYFDCHLMVSDPMKWVKSFAEAGANCITFHYEACSSDKEIKEIISAIVDLNVDVGIAINPDTSLSKIENLLNDNRIHHILVMTVNPGFGGQKFNTEAVKKVSEIKKINYKILVEVDGGVNLQTIELAIAHGADIIVVGSALFNATNRKATQLEFLKLLEKVTC